MVARTYLAIELLKKIDADGANLIHAYSNYIKHTANKNALLEVYRSLYKLALSDGKVDEGLRDDPELKSQGWGQVKEVQSEMLDYCRLRILHDMIKSGSLKGVINKQALRENRPVYIAYLHEPLSRSIMNEIEIKANKMFNELEVNLCDFGLVCDKDFTLQIINKYLESNTLKQNSAHICDLVYDIMKDEEADKFMADLECDNHVAAFKDGVDDDDNIVGWQKPPVRCNQIQ